MTWQERRSAEIDECVSVMLKKYDITDVTSKVQKKNGTIMFQFGKERFGVYESGMVRKYFKTRFSQWSCYQLNRTRNCMNYFETYSYDTGKLQVRSYEGKKRVMILGQIARLKYLEQYLIKNRDLSEDVITVNGIKYRKIQ